jgi:hypothetical protein
MEPRRLLRWPLPLAAALLLTGCPYSSEFPLCSPAEAVADTELPGTWKPAPEAGAEEDFTLTIRASDGLQLTLTAESPGEEQASYPAFVSAVGAERFLNLQDEGDTERWYFANYRLEAGRLRLRLVDDELFASRTVADAWELRSLIELHLEDPRLYGAPNAEQWDWVLERVGP